MVRASFNLFDRTKFRKKQNSIKQEIDFAKYYKPTKTTTCTHAKLTQVPRRIHIRITFKSNPIIMNLPESILDRIVEYNDQQATIDNLLELNQELFKGSTFLSLVEENQLELVKTAVRVR